MFGLSPSEDARASAVLNALGRSLAIIEFDPTGKILTANENFCRAMGYDIAEIQGKHHSIFVSKGYASSDEYKGFWLKLGRGEFDAREYQRVGKGGREIWIQASYNPVKDAKSRVVRVVKVATDITAEKLKNADYEGKIEAISRVQAVIEFTPAGEVLTANENFLSVLGYRLDEIKGQHHRMFVEPELARSSEYSAFWDQLNRGEYVSASFKRVAKGGREVWIQASYNPIVDLNGRVLKVVKFATDITDLTHIGSGLARLADNNLQQRIETPFAPAFEKLRTDFNHAHDNLSSALTRIVEGTRAIATSGTEISSTADELAKRTEQQAASLEETAAALDQITATVRKTADGANHARDVVMTAKTDTERSGEVVNGAVQATAEIDRSSKQISNIIGVIDEIAFQTNLLALNAGVEAARAGEAGKGFAVVASEVRALAQRSAEAAKEIKTLIQASSAQVDNGVGLVGQAGEALGRIATQITEINSVILDIAGSAKEQATGLAEVNTAVNQMDQVTQQNAAMVEQSTAASHSLAHEAQELRRLVSVFRLSEGEHANAAGKPAGPARRPTRGGLSVAA